MAAAAIIFGIWGPYPQPLDYAPGRYYILDALNQLIGLVPGEENKQFLQQTAHEIVEHASPGTSATLPVPSSGVPPGNWTGLEEGANAEELFNEKIIDENTLHPIYYLIFRPFSRHE